MRRRTAITLLNMVYRYGDESGSPHDTELRISQTDLANMLGVSRQTIGKELAQLKDEGVLGCNEGYRLITVVDLPKLHRITAED
ncbi:Bifunctional ligase/repressor BirA [compost metagenome]